MRFVAWVVGYCCVTFLCTCGLWGWSGLVRVVVFMLAVVGLVGCYWICGLLLVCLVVVCDVSW